MLKNDEERREVIAGLKDPTRWCPTCGGASEHWEAFCIKCGNANPNFSLTALQQEDGVETFEEASKKNCPDFHQYNLNPQDIGAALDNLDAEEFPFCPYCGINIIELARRQ